MRTIIISQRIEDKLDSKHTVSEEEIEQCLDNRCGSFLIDNREDHQTDPPSLWFIAETRVGRLLKVILIFRDGNIFIKSAFDPSESDIALYEAEGK